MRTLTYFASFLRSLEIIYTYLSFIPKYLVSSAVFMRPIKHTHYYKIRTSTAFLRRISQVKTYFSILMFLFFLTYKFVEHDRMVHLRVNILVYNYL